MLIWVIVVSLGWLSPQTQHTQGATTTSPLTPSPCRSRGSERGCYTTSGDTAIGLDRSGPFYQGAASIGFIAALNHWLTVDPTRFGPEFTPRSRWTERLESITLRLGPWVFAKRFEPLEAVVIDFHDEEGFHVRVRFDRPTRAPDPIIEGVRAFGGQAIPPRVAVAESPPPMRWHFATLRERDRFLAALSCDGVRVSEVPPTEEGVEGPRTPASVDGAPGVECRYSRIWLEGCWPVGAER